MPAPPAVWKTVASRSSSQATLSAPCPSGIAPTLYRCDKQVPVLFQDGTGLGLSNQAVSIVLQKVSPPHQPVRGRAHLRDVLFMAAVALFERRSRVTGCQPLAPGFGEGNKCARVRPNASLVKTAGVCVPARVGSQRNLMQDAGYAHSFIAVSVHSRDHHRQSLADGRWLNIDDARQVTVMELPSEVVVIKRRDNTVRKWYSWNHRKTHRGLSRRRQLSSIKPRILARRWKRAFHHP